MSALVSADPVALDLVHHGTIELGERLKLVAGEVGDALDAARRGCPDRLGGLPDAALDVLDLAREALAQADLARDLARGMRTADEGSVAGSAEGLPLDLLSLLSGGSPLVPLMPGTTPSVLPPVLVAYAHALGQAGSGDGAALSDLFSMLSGHRDLGPPLARAIAVARGAGVAASGLGLDVGWTRWADRGSILARTEAGQLALKGASAVAIGHDLFTIGELFAHHASAADKVDAGLQLGFDGSLAAFRLAPNPWTGFAVGATGVAWGGFKIGRELWDHREGIESGARVLAHDAAALGQGAIGAARDAVAVGHDAVAVARELRRSLESVARGAVHSGHDLFDLAHQLVGSRTLMPPIGLPGAGPVVYAGARAVSQAEDAIAHVPGKVFSGARSLMRSWLG